MKYLLTIIVILSSFVGRSQAVPVYDSLGNLYTFVEDTLHLPYSVAKSIAKDLISYDSTKAELQLTQEQLKLTEEKVSSRDKSIKIYEQKVKTYEEQLATEREKTKIWEDQSNTLAKQNKKLKTKLIFTKSIGVALLATAVYFGIVR